MHSLTVEQAGVNTFLDVARKTFKEIEGDVNELVAELKGNIGAKTPQDRDG
jgi:hypothetical protein